MSSSGYSKELGRIAETLVRKHYIALGYTDIESNWMMMGGELDIIAQDEKSNLIFVEVKCVDHTDDLFGYVTKKKLHTLKRSIEHYCIQTEREYAEIRLDIVFVKHGQIIEIFENIIF